MCRCLELAGTVSPFISIARPVYHSSCSAACSISPFILAIVLPVSSTSVCSNSSPRSRMRLAIALRYLPRSLISRAAQAGCAFSAGGPAPVHGGRIPGHDLAQPLFIGGIYRLDPIVGLARDHLAANQHLT